MKKNKSVIYRQGDVLIQRINKIPSTARRVKGRIILAYGEATGHHHSIAETDPADWWKQDDGSQYVHVKTSSPVIVTHQEHDPIVLPKGKYSVTIQREYSPAQIRNVQD